MNIFSWCKSVLSGPDMKITNYVVRLTLTQWDMMWNFPFSPKGIKANMRENACGCIYVNTLSWLPLFEADIHWVYG